MSSLAEASGSVTRAVVTIMLRNALADIWTLDETEESDAIRESAHLRAQNARLRRELEQLRTLARVSVEQPNTHELTKLIARHAADCLEAEQALVGLVVGDAIHVETAYRDGQIQPVDLWIARGENAAGLALDKRHPVICVDAASDALVPALFRRDFQCRSILCAPMLDHQNQVLGVIQWHNRCDGRPFDESDTATAQGVAMQAAVAFQRSRFYDKTQRWMSSLESLLAFNSVINENVNPDVLVRQLIEHAAGFLDSDGGLAGLVTETQVAADGYLHHGAWNDIRKAWPLHVGLPGWVVANHCPYLANDYPGDLQAEEDWIRRFDVQHAVCVSIVDAHNQPLGFFELHKSRGRLPFTWQDASFLESLANIAAVAISNARLVKDLEENRRQLAALSAQHVNWIEDERCRLARELHDETGQALVGIKLSLQVLARQIPAEHASLRREADHVREQVNRATAQLKSIARMLRPPTLDQLGLDAALRQLAHDFQQRADISIEVETRLASRPQPTIETALYRIAQEALTNVARHADAARAWLELHGDSETLTLVIRDDGIGFAVPQTTQGLGLVGMRERAAMLGGALTISSAPNRGATIAVTIPLRTRL